MAEELDKAVFGAFGGGFVHDVEALFGASESDIKEALLVVENYIFGLAEKAIEVSVRVNAGNDALVGLEEDYHVGLETFAFMHGHETKGLIGILGIFQVERFQEFGKGFLQGVELKILEISFVVAMKKENFFGGGVFADDFG